MGSRVGYWLRQRNWRLVLLGSPAVIVPVLFGAAVVAGTTANDVGLRYLQSAQAANRGGNSAAALVYAEAAVRHRPADPVAQFELAIAAAGTHDAERATTILQSLAPPERRGYGPAHLLVAQNILAQPAPNAEQLRVAETHLLWADETFDVNKEELNLYLGELLFITGRLPQAKERLERAGSLMPAKLRLGQIAAAHGDDSHAQTYAESCRLFFAAKLQSTPESLIFRAFLMESHLLRGDFPQALATIEEGLTRTPDNPQLRSQRATVYLQWLAQLDRTATTPPGEKLRLLERGLTAEPANPALLMRLWAFSEMAGPQATEARGLLHQQLALGQNTAVAHFILGTTAWQAGQGEEAKLHLEQAYKLGPKLPVVGNNLAWVLADRSPPQLDRALELIDAVLANSPANPRYRGTRGYVLSKLGRWKDAITDLEASLARPDVEAETHELLAEAYTKLGDASMAKQHQQLSQTRPRRNAGKK
jgi:predicted Zn-dependent protease